MDADKIFGGVGRSPRTNRLDFGGNPVTIWIHKFFKGYTQQIVLSKFYSPGG